MMNYETLEKKGLPGCKPIREALSLTQSQLAKLTEVHLSFIFCVENGRKDCSQAVQRKIAGALSCEVTDLLKEPTSERLQEIKDAYELRGAQEIIARQADKKAGAA